MRSTRSNSGRNLRSQQQQQQPYFLINEISQSELISRESTQERQAKRQRSAKRKQARERENASKTEAVPESTQPQNDDDASLSRPISTGNWWDVKEDEGRVYEERLYVPSWFDKMSPGRMDDLINYGQNILFFVNYPKAPKSGLRLPMYLLWIETDWENYIEADKIQLRIAMINNWHLKEGEDRKIYANGDLVASWPTLEAENPYLEPADYYGSQTLPTKGDHQRAIDELAQAVLSLSSSASSSSFSSSYSSSFASSSSSTVAAASSSDSSSSATASSSSSSSAAASPFYSSSSAAAFSSSSLSAASATSSSSSSSSSSSFNSSTLSSSRSVLKCRCCMCSAQERIESETMNRFRSFHDEEFKRLLESKSGNYIMHRKIFMFN